MQEQNFEKQVKQKMEELSLTPSEPVWKKVEEQIRKKRDRRRFFFWLPLTVLLVGGGVWLASGIKSSNNSIGVISKEQKKNTEDTISIIEETITSDKVQSRQPSIKTDKEQTTITKENFQQQNKNLTESKTGKQLLTPVKNTKNLTQKNKIINANNVPAEKRIFSKDQKQADEINNTDITDGIQKPAEIKEQPVNEILTGESKSNDTLTNSPVKQNELKNEDTATKINPGLKADEKDSLAVQKDIAKNKKNISSKWKFAIDAGIGRSGVNNGVELFGGGAKSLETTNAFAADRSTNYSQAPSNTGSFYRPPSSQKKSSSFLLGVLVKKQMGKRSSLSTGLQYNFYSTQMQVGQNIVSDTVVDQNKTVNSFYTNSGSNFSDYRNKFHFIAVPVSFDFQLLNKIPLDFHIGLSLQQLVETNALLYSSRSQVYYNDKAAFNKTYLFSEFGFEYSFPLSKNLSFRAGPRINYSHSRIIKESSDRHLFSYGLVTQFVFSGK